MAVIAIINHKGGVGKTTTAVNLGAALQELGKRVLLIDLDPQASLTVHLGIRHPESLPANAGHVLKARAAGERSPALRDVLTRSPAGLDLIPAGRQLAEAEMHLGQDLSWTFVLSECLAPLRQEYDYILIDCLPSKNLLVFNALSAADAILVPLQTDYLAAQGLAMTFQTAVTVQKRFNPRIRVMGILMTMVDTRTAHSRQVVAAVRRSFTGKIRVFETVVRQQVGFKESSRAGTSVLRYNPGSVSAMAYRSLASEVVAAAEEMGLVPGAEGRSAGKEEAAALAEAAMVALAQAEDLARAEGLTLATRVGKGAGRMGERLPDAAGSDAGAERAQSCPLLGVFDDRAKRLADPSNDHRCWADEVPLVVDLPTQQTLCLQSSHFACPRYLKHSLVARQQPKVSLFDRLRYWLHTPH